jgi:hypothetical protein
MGMSGKSRINLDIIDHGRGQQAKRHRQYQSIRCAGTMRPVSGVWAVPPCGRSMAAVEGGLHSCLAPVTQESDSVAREDGEVISPQLQALDRSLFVLILSCRYFFFWAKGVGLLSSSSA